MAAGMPRTSFATRVSLETIDRDAFTHHAGQARSSQGRGHPQIVYKGGEIAPGRNNVKTFGEWDCAALVWRSLPTSGGMDFPSASGGRTSGGA